MSTSRATKPSGAARARAKARAKPCPVCSSVSREAVDAMLASNAYASPARIARTLKGFSRAQIKRHKARCLKGIPRLSYAMKQGIMTAEEARERVAGLKAQGKHPEVELDRVLGLIEGLAASDADAKATLHAGAAQQLEQAGG